MNMPANIEKKNSVSFKLNSKRAHQLRQRAALHGLPEFMIRLAGSNRLPTVVESVPKYRND
jgi:hypothetical protein